MSRFTEEKLEMAILELLAKEGFTPVGGDTFVRATDDVLLRDDLRQYLARRYAEDGITEGEINHIFRQLDAFSVADLYESNKAIMKMVSDGFLLKREDRKKKDLYVDLIDYRGIPEQRCPKPGEVPTVMAEKLGAYRTSYNIYKAVNQLKVTGTESRIPDCIIYINGLPLVVFEFKSAIREEATIHDAYVQLTTRYRRDIPELFKFNAICIISDGVNNKAGSFFADYEYFYAWRKTNGGKWSEKDGIDSLYSMISGLFNLTTLRDVIRNFVYFPDTSSQDVKIVCRYPQFYGARALYDNIKAHRRPEGDGKGGTYFGATGCGKSFTMLFLSRLLMKSIDFSSPTIVLISDRIDLDDQLSGQFVNAKSFIGDEEVVSVKSREHLRQLLKERRSGGVFLTTVHKFTEDTKLLTSRSNVICISDEAHRSQVNLEQKVRITKKGVQRTYGFAKHLRNSLPNATYVGFTGTPIDATLDVFGDVVEAYTMAESVRDEITVPIVYEGRAAKVLLVSNKLQEIEAYYAQCAEEGTSSYAIEESKRANANMNSILGDPDILKAVAEDFVAHYEKRVSEGATVRGKAMFVCGNRQIAYDLFKYIVALRPQWGEVKASEDGVILSDRERREIKPMERIKMVMTRGQDDPQELYDLLGNSDYRKELDRQFKSEKTNFKIALVVDMWLTGFDVPFLDTLYIYKPVQRHNLIQTISRVNRKYGTKEKGLIVDYIGIKKQMDLALAQYAKTDSTIIEEIQQSIVVVKDHLDLLAQLFHQFDLNPYFSGKPLEQLHCLNMAAEYVQATDKIEKRFMGLVKRMKAAYNICCGSDAFTQAERDHAHFYMAVRSIVFKLTKGDAPDLAQMNAKVQKMIKEALRSDGVEEVLKLGQDKSKDVDIFDEEYLAKLEKIKLPNTKIRLLQQLLQREIDEFRKVNKVKAVDFSKMFKAIVDKYNDRKEDSLVSSVLEHFTDEIIDLYHAMKKEKESFAELGIDFEEKAFYDILKSLADKYDFKYPEEELIPLSKKVKEVVDDKAKYTDWSKRTDIKAELKADLIVLLAEHGYPPVDRDEVYKEIFEQAENFKKYQS